MVKTAFNFLFRRQINWRKFKAKNSKTAPSKNRKSNIATAGNTKGPGKHYTNNRSRAMPASKS
jgi:hypothetical protein